MSLDDATRVQNDASDPAGSTWVSANAGAGKTRVLIDRVARLLLRGSDPQNILCLTYTKAAAAEMQNRLFATLGRWTMASDAALHHALSGMGEERLPDLARARTLFARAIETPGGLKIQTIHSFAAALLRQFPVEAGVTPNFRELEQAEATALLDETVEKLARERDSAFLGFVACHRGETLTALTAEIAAARSGFGKATPESLSRALGLDPGTTRDTLAARLSRAMSGGWWAAVADVLSGQSPFYAATAERMARIDCRALSAEDLEWLENTFIDSKGVPKVGRWPQTNHKAVRDAVAEWSAEIDAFIENVGAYRAGCDALACRDATSALHAFAERLLAVYAELKAARGVLDFDDLIERASALLGDARMDWVRYRMDARIEHILVDEAQDTSQAQWRIIQALADEIAAGEGTDRPRPRTLFVVGDRKQSIYSFQGADAAAFDSMEAHFAERMAAAPAPMRRHELGYSFRSAQAILQAADEVLVDHPGGPGGGRIRHHAFFEAMPGRVDLWPKVPVAADAEKTHWFDPVDLPSEDAARVRLSDRVADEIARILAHEFIPRSDGSARRVRPGDVLVLVQTRGIIFDRIIARLQALGVPVAGPDRLHVTETVAVRDLLALLRFLALPQDDLSLAEALRSPLFGWSEARLYDLAAQRTRRRLWDELDRRRDEFSDTHERLRQLRRAADFARPYELLEMVLVGQDGRRRIAERLGPEAEDAVEEFLSFALAFERNGPPDLTAFLAAAERGGIEIKRSAESAGDRVRVMTVHGAKGLEAPIVVLPDTVRQDGARGTVLPRAMDGTPLYGMPAKSAPAAQTDFAEARAEADRAERERLLYVAMTRAENWLIVCGADMKRKGGFWYDAVDAALRRRGATPLATPTGDGLRLSNGDWPTVASADEAKRAPAASPPLSVPADPPPPLAEPVRVLTPSALEGDDRRLAQSRLDPETARRRGTAIHLLIEHVSPGTSAREMAALLANHGLDDQAGAVDEALAVLRELPELFAPGVLAEVPLAGRLSDGTLIDGTIDRLLVDDRRVRIVDFKSHDMPPAEPCDVPPGILAQMGAYLVAAESIWPGREIAVELLWTAGPRSMPLPHGILRDALAVATIS